MDPSIAGRGNGKSEGKLLFILIDDMECGIAMCDDWHCDGWEGFCNEGFDCQIGRRLADIDVCDYPRKPSFGTVTVSTDPLMGSLQSYRIYTTPLPLRYEVFPLNAFVEVMVAALTQYLLECTATGKKPVDQIIALRKGLSDSPSDMMKANEAIFGFSRALERELYLDFENYKKWKPHVFHRVPI